MTIREIFLDIAGLAGIIWILFCGFEIIYNKIASFRKSRVKAKDQALEEEITEIISEDDSSIEKDASVSPENKVNTNIRAERESENRESLVNYLKNMGCQPETEEDGNVVVSFQGERFLFMFNGAFLRIWDLNWMSTKSTDDDYALLKDAINYANFSFGPSILMHAPDLDGNIYISSSMDVLYDPDKDDNKEYLVSLFEAFFALKHILHREYLRLKDNPEDRTLALNPIGFNTAALSDPDSPQAN